MVLDTFTKIFREIRNFVKIGQKYRTLYKKSSVYFIVDRRTKYFVAGQQSKGTHCCISTTTLTLFCCSQLHVSLQKYEGNYCCVSVTVVTRMRHCSTICTLGIFLFFSEERSSFAVIRSKTSSIIILCACILIFSLLVRTR